MHIIERDTNIKCFHLFFDLEFNYCSVCFIGKDNILIHMSFEVMIKENKNTEKPLVLLKMFYALILKLYIRLFLEKYTF